MFVERHCCPVCLSDQNVSVYSKPYVGSEVETLLRSKYDRKPRPDYALRFNDYDFTILSCESCGALFQRLAPDEDLAAEYYGDWIAGHGSPELPLGEYTHSINEAMTLTAFLLKQTGKAYPSELAVLDYGVGQGVFALAMRACGCRVSAFDLSEGRNETARANGLTVVSHDQIPGLDFDFINTEQVFEHLPNPRATAERLAEGLSPKGILKISVPYARWLERGPLKIDWTASARSRNSINPIHPLEHLTYFRRPSLDLMMMQLGFSRKKVALLDELNYLFDWNGLRNFAKNLIRPFAKERFRNYFLYGR